MPRRSEKKPESAPSATRRVLPMLAEERVVWLSTVRPDGTPHLVPTWFVWNGDALHGLVAQWTSSGRTTCSRWRRNGRG